MLFLIFTAITTAGCPCKCDPKMSVAKVNIADAILPKMHKDSIVDAYSMFNSPLSQQGFQGFAEVFYNATELANIMTADTVMTILDEKLACCLRSGVSVVISVSASVNATL